MSKLRRFMDWSGHGYLALPMRWYLGYVFIAASLHKIAHPEMFAVDVATYDILPLYLINIMALILPWIEIIAGGMLIVGYKGRAAALMVLGMMAMFIVALIMALAEGLDMSCGCFASQGAQDEDPISYMTVLRDLAWLALSAYVLFFDSAPLGVDRFLEVRRRRHA